MYSDPASSDDDEVGPETYTGITSEQKVLMDSGLAHIRSLLGPDIGSDRYIRQALWDSYFEVEATTQWLLEQRDEAERAQKAKEKQKGKRTSGLSFVAFLSMLPFGNITLLPAYLALLCRLASYALEHCRRSCGELGIVICSSTTVTRESG